MNDNNNHRSDNVSNSVKTIGIKKTITVDALPPGTYAGVQSGHMIAIPAGPESTVKVGDRGVGYKTVGEVYEINLADGIRGTSEVTVTIDNKGDITVT